MTVISNSEEDSLFFHSQQSTYDARDSYDLKLLAAQLLTNFLSHVLSLSQE